MKYKRLKLLLSFLFVCLGVTFIGIFVKLQFEIEIDGSAGSNGKGFTIPIPTPTPTPDSTAKGRVQHTSHTNAKSDTSRSKSNNSKERTFPLRSTKRPPSSKNNEEIFESEPKVKIGTVTATRKQQQNPGHEGTPILESQYQDHSRKRKNYDATTETEILEFSRQEGVVIVTKVHGPHQLALLRQSICLLHYAYNSKVGYDIVVFTTIPIAESNQLLKEIRTTVSPARLTVVLDNDGIVNEIAKLSPVRRRKFLERCNATSPEEVTWDSECNEDGGGRGRIRYNWQAEFRSWHIWRHDSLRQYRYMLWIDTDAFCTTAWDRDPIAIVMKNNLVIYFDNYPQGRAKAAQPIVKEVFGKYLCSARKSPNGTMISSVGDDCGASQLWTIHGFHHITDMNFFRQDQVMHWAEKMIGDCFLCRQFDDQLAVTVPPFMMAPERSWDMYKSGVQSKIFHNHKIDGKRMKKAGSFHRYWKENAESQFPDAWKNCEITEGD